MTVMLDVCILLQSLSYLIINLPPLTALALTALYTWLWNPSKRDNPVSAFLCGLVACLQPWAPCRVILLLHLLGKLCRKGESSTPTWSWQGFYYFFSIFLGRGESWIWILMVSPGGSTRGIVCNTISSMSGSSIKHWKAIFNLYFVFH